MSDAKLYTYIIFLFVCCSCHSDANSEKITNLKGTIDNPSIKELYLRDSNNLSQFETIEVIDGGFSYSLSTEIPEPRFITNETYNVAINLITEPGDLTIDYKNGDYTSNSQLTNQFNEYYKKAISLQKIRGSDSIKYETEMRELIIKMVDQNKTNGISLHALLVGPNYLPNNETLFDSLHNTIDSNFILKANFGERIIRMEKLRKNAQQLAKTLPSISVMDSNGVFLNLQSLKGKYTYIDFWASWCGPCIKKIPELKRIYKILIMMYSSCRFQLIGIWKIGKKKLKSWI